MPRGCWRSVLVVILVSLTSGLLLKAARVPQHSEMLLSVSKAPALLRLSVLFELINSSAIVVLASLPLRRLEQAKTRFIALGRPGMVAGRALALILRQRRGFALVPLSLDFVAAELRKVLSIRRWANFWYGGLYTFGYSTVHMWFYCIGAVVDYLFFKSKYIPRAISLFGLAAVSLPSWFHIPVLRV